ncbi:MAG TPA: diacylglycerol kinase family protein [Burkholderiales bacterium]|nr:diacylglycerol kinase family protein [Burkholderiales bacterium]
MRVTLIHNPGAGRSGEDDARKLEDLLESAGHNVRYQSSKEPGWKRALAKPADVVVVAGGDGTVGRVVRRMVGRGVPVTLLPLGTANNIARTFGLLDRPFQELIQGWKRARRVKLDLGIAKGPWDERYFIEGVGVGLFANMLAQPRSGKKSKARKPEDVVDRALQRLKDMTVHSEPVEVIATLDGEDISGRYLLFEAINLRYVGPNLFLAPDGKPGDGKLDLVLITEAERVYLLEYLEKWQHDRDRLAVLPTRRGELLRMEWNGSELHIDDKLYPRKNPDPGEVSGIVETRIKRGAVEFLLPEIKA